MQDITLEKLKEVGWMRLNVGAPDQRAPHAEGNFKTPSGKCEFFSERLARHVGSSRMVVCDISGTRYTSERFAEWIRNERDRDHDLAFVIGGASGLSEDLVERSSAKLALAPWTLAHELARLVLAEQLYRAGTIVRGEPYHK